MIYIEDGRAVAYDTVELDVAAEEVTVRRHLVEPADPAVPAPTTTP